MFATATFFMIYLYIEAIIQENTLQIFTFILFHVYTLLYGVLMYFHKISNTPTDVLDTITEDSKPYLIAVPCILSTTLGFWIYISFKLYGIFGWEMYKLIGANVLFRDMYKQYLLFVQLLKMDFYFFVTFASQYVLLILHSGDIELPITVALVPISLVTLIIAVYALKRESRFLMWIFILGLIGFIGYYTFKLVRIYDNTQDTKYENQRLVLSFFGFLGLITVVFTVFQAIKCLTNFGQGLSKRIEMIEGNVNENFIDGNNFYINSAGQRRMALEEYNA
ncbi:UPF0658 Golgi apparatus membrane protein [Smittium culicis]|uniref:UPF0658 Golgi apparatus membrane protein n=1 Tax=Smittium culicis TaxID=133412 RepID=A0A1R1YD66_9FUNG|nr:UPF0658 Golgi apparatus membrane protein [Smittium culicis]